MDSGSVAKAIFQAIHSRVDQQLRGDSNTHGTSAETQSTSRRTSSTTFNRASSLSLTRGNSNNVAGPSTTIPGSGNGSGPVSRENASPQPGMKRRFVVPTMYQTKAKRKKAESKPKSVKYLRDIFCLPHECLDDDGTIAIPRGTSRSYLASNEIGLMGKIEFCSDWSAGEMKEEICRLFAKPFGLSEDDIDVGKLFPFEYLQKTGAGSRTLCVPVVTTNYEWNGRQVATLAKSGGVIYVLAR